MIFLVCYDRRIFPLILELRKVGDQIHFDPLDGMSRVKPCLRLPAAARVGRLIKTRHFCRKVEGLT